MSKSCWCVVSADTRVEPSQRQHTTEERCKHGDSSHKKDGKCIGMFGTTFANDVVAGVESWARQETYESMQMRVVEVVHSRTVKGPRKEMQVQQRPRVKPTRNKNKEAEVKAKPSWFLHVIVNVC